MATALDQPTGGTARRSAGISAVLDVLDALDRHGPVTLAQLSRETGVAKSTLHRVCSTMGERGWIARDLASGNIELGPRVAWLARANPASALTAGFYEAARGLVERHNETTCLTVLDGCESVFVAKQETTHPVRLVTAVGSRLPAFACASGRAMLADLPNLSLRDAIKTTPREMLSGEMVARHGAEFRVLVKLLDPGEAIPFHFHATDAQVKRLERTVFRALSGAELAAMRSVLSNAIGTLRADHGDAHDTVHGRGRVGRQIDHPNAAPRSKSLAG